MKLERMTKAQLIERITEQNVYIAELNKKMGEQDKKIKELERKLESENYQNGFYDGTKEGIERGIKQEREHRNAGRKQNYHLRTYLLSCWAKEMTDKEIIGSEYDGYNGKEKVTRASYYRAKKELYHK